MLAPLLAALLGAAAPAVPAGPHWRVDWGEPRCMLVREGRPEDPTLAIRFVPADRAYEVWLINPQWKANSFATFPPVELVLEGEDGAPVEHFVSLAVGSTGLRALATENGGEDFLDRFVKARAVSLRRKKGAEILNIPVPGAAAAVAAARTCEDNMLRLWGVDPAAWRAFKERPKPIDPGRWLSSDDYPGSALRMDMSGITVARVNVSAEGKATACTIVASSGSKALDEATCGAPRRGRFSPAISADGKAVPSLTIFKVAWRLFG